MVQVLLYIYEHFENIGCSFVWEYRIYRSIERWESISEEGDEIDERRRDPD